MLVNIINTCVHEYSLPVVLAQLVKLLHEGEDKGLSCCEQYHELAAAITEAEKAQQTAQGILTGNAR